MDGTLCDTIIGALDVDVLVVGRGGQLVHANNHALERMKHPAQGTPLSDLFDEWGGAVRARLMRAAQSTQWVPVNLVLKGDTEQAATYFRARGIRNPGEDEPLLLLVADRSRDQGFAQLRELVRDLNRELAARQLMQLRLKESLASEARLHSELIHRVKNNFALLNALINFRQRASSDPAVRAALKDLEHRVHAILAVHELLDRAGEIDYVQAGDLIRSLCKQLERSLLPDNVEIENDLLDVSLNVRDATPLSLLVNELIINAVKHAFPDGRRGTVKVGLKKNGVDKLEVSIADDGAGYPDAAPVEGSGSRIVDALARQIGGTLERSHADGGTHWSFVFPYSEREPERPLRGT